MAETAWIRCDSGHIFPAPASASPRLETRNQTR